MKKKSKTDSVEKEIVPCRLERAYREALEGQAAERKTTVSKLVREHIIKGLHEDGVQPEDVHEALKCVVDGLRELRRDLALLGEMLLHEAGKMEREEAFEWIQKNIPAE